MILGLPTGAFTTIHVVVSLVAILMGFIVVAEMLRTRFPRHLTAVFLVTTIGTSVTGFLFHSRSVGPPHIVGALSLILLGAALFAFDRRHRRGVWRVVYVVSAVLALYLNVFVGVVQAFAKLAPLRALAPTQTEPPFAVAQGLTLLLFVGLGVFAVRRTRPVVGGAVNLAAAATENG